MSAKRNGGKRKRVCKRKRRSGRVEFARSSAVEADGGIERGSVVRDAAVECGYLMVFKHGIGGRSRETDDGRNKVFDAFRVKHA